MTAYAATRFIARGVIFATLAGGLFAISGCTYSSYATPGGPAQLAELATTPGDIREKFESEPAARFPARLAVVRLQGAEYRSYSHSGYGTGRYTVITARDAEAAVDVDRLKRLPHLADIAALNRLVLPQQLDSVRDMRLSAASLKTDMLLLYTFDTHFRVNGQNIGPFGVITLGVLPIDEAVVTCTCSGALFDVRTGFVYGLIEKTVTEKQMTSAWTSKAACESARQSAEAAAFKGLVDEFETLWKKVVEQHASRALVQTAAPVAPAVRP